MSIFSLLSPSQKKRETNLSRERKNAAVFANIIVEDKSQSLTEVTAVSTTNVCHESKKSFL